jgi:nickel/cobalt transporter (NiCoT) family protein
MTTLTGREKMRVLSLFFVIGAATLVGFLASSYIGSQSVLLAGLGIVAYVFGLRHGVDADHIAAIDNTTRKLMQQEGERDGKKPLTVGAWFSLGHSTIVVALILLLVFATRAVVGAVPQLQSIGSVLGTSVSGIFLWLIGILNVVTVVGIYKIFKGLKGGKLDQNQLEELLNNRGFMNRYFGKLFKLIRKPWQIYPVGVLFGLGFDTASEVALIAISVGVGVASSIPVWMVLVLPFMFTCGMVLVDTSDGIAMSFAYGWAFLKPIRKIYYNLTITIISVLVAFCIGTVELLQVLSSELQLGGVFWGWLEGLNFETIGYAIIGIFIGSWLISMAYYKVKKFEDFVPMPVTST